MLKKWFLLALGIFTGLAFGNSDAPHGIASQIAKPSVAFYYGNEPPDELLAQFDWIVIEAALVTADKRKALQRHGGKLFAYVSVGELEEWRGTTVDLPASVIMTRNHDWNSQVVDLRRPEWREYLIEQRIRPLWEKGYRALFLDTLDSYRLFAPDGPSAEAQQEALVELILAIHEHFPEIELLLNRGFEILDQIQAQVVGVAAESLYRRWNPATRVFGPVPEADQVWLYERLREVRDDYGLPAIAIDYVPSHNRELARETAHRIHAEDFIPWVSVPELNQVGIGLIEPMPRRVLILYDRDNTEHHELAHSSAHRYLAMPLEYLGYGAEYLDVNEPLPSDVLHGRYAGVVTWFEQPLADGQVYRDWLLRQMQAGLRVAMFGHPGIDLAGPLSEFMGIRHRHVDERHAYEVAAYDALIDFEGMPTRPPLQQNGFELVASDLSAHLTLRNSRGDALVPVLSGPWGGIATSPWIMQQAREYQQRWIIDPFAFFETVLALPAMPIADATTENGARYWMAQIDGDAFVSRADMPGAPFTGEVMLKEILERYRIPTTVSIIEGEIGPEGLYPHYREALEPLARRIFALPWVEIATHTFSHPFEWENLEEGSLAGQGKTQAGFNYNMPIPGYRFSLEREIKGSVEYINRHLAPPGKAVEVVLWTGNALPPEKALAITAELGLRNMNGGNTSMTLSFPSLTRVSPMLRPQGEYLQVYAPQINENVYTNNMLGPLWGYRRAIETYQLTDEPRRLKPIDIYYHFYSAASPASLKALQQVYDYVETQETLPIYVSDWSGVASAWYHLGIARQLEGGWQIRGAEQIRTLRLPESFGWPDLEHSQGVAGVREITSGRYVALSGQNEAMLQLSNNAPRTPYLRFANGRLQAWSRRSSANVTMRLAAEHVPLRVELAGVEGCHVHAPGAEQRRLADGIVLSYRLAQPEQIEVACDQ